MIRSLAALNTLSFLLPSLTLAMSPLPQNGGFSDVPFSHPNAEAIAYVKAQGIVEGYADGTFKPDQTINRAEFTKIVILSWESAYISYDSDQCDSYLRVLKDIDANNAWYRTYLCIGLQNGIIHGYPDYTFRPGNEINFAEASKIIAQVSIRDKQDILPYVPTGSPWYATYVQYLERYKAVPYSIGTLDKKITRGEMAEMIYLLHKGEMSSDNPGYTYTIQYYNETETGLSIEKEYDGRVIQYNTETGKSLILLESIKDALPALEEEWNLTLTVASSTSTSRNPFFRTTLKETGYSGGEIYMLDLQTLSFAAPNQRGI